MFSDLVVWYLFLGGSGAGAVMVLATLDLVRGAVLVRAELVPLWAHALNRTFFARGYAASTIALASGALCLLADLGRPERFFYVLTHPAPSLLAFGSFVLVGTLLCAVALSGIALSGSRRIPIRAVQSIEAAAVLFGACTALYTGAFLSTIDFVPWWEGPVLPVLFAVSSLSAGVACALGSALLDDNVRKVTLLRTLTRMDSIVLGVEVLCVGIYVAWLLFTQGEGALIALSSGPNGLLFWCGFAAVGLGFPLVFDAAYSRMDSVVLPAAALGCTLVGGFLLRYCMVSVPFG